MRKKVRYCVHLHHCNCDRGSEHIYTSIYWSNIENYVTSSSDSIVQNEILSSIRCIFPCTVQRALYYNFIYYWIALNIFLHRLQRAQRIIYWTLRNSRGVYQIIGNSDIFVLIHNLWSCVIGWRKQLPVSKQFFTLEIRFVVWFWKLHEYLSLVKFDRTLSLSERALIRNSQNIL